MPTTINDTIHHLLMEEEQVCLPGLGTLRLTPQPALISPIEGKAVPPSEMVNFNGNLVLDDGRIIRALEESGGYSREEAQLELGEYLRNLQENLDAGRAMTLEGIGRFFKHYDGQIRFTAGGENFSKESFGLPTIDLRPIVRTEKQRRAAVDPILSANSTAPASPPEENVAKEGILYNPELRRVLWFVVAGMATLLLLIALFRIGQYVFGRNAGDPREPIARNADAPRLKVPADRINVSPAPPPVDARDVRPADAPRLNDPKPETPPRVNTAPEATPQTDNGTSPAPAIAGDNVALIATGMYGSQRNVEKNINRIKAAGFETFTLPEGRLTRIGAKYEYRTEDELSTALERIQRLYSDSFVIEINGKKQ